MRVRPAPMAHRFARVRGLKRKAGAALRTADKLGAWIRNRWVLPIANRRNYTRARQIERRGGLGIAERERARGRQQALSSPR
jgi:hypothetical protein